MGTKDFEFCSMVEWGGDSICEYNCVNYGPKGLDQVIAKIHGIK